MFSDEDDPIMQRIVRESISEGGFKIVIRDDNVEMTPEIEEYLEDIRQKIMESAKVDMNFLKRGYDER